MLPDSQVESVHVELELSVSAMWKCWISLVLVNDNESNCLSWKQIGQVAVAFFLTCC